MSFLQALLERYGGHDDRSSSALAWAKMRPFWILAIVTW
jgi:hypothetical protein